MLRWVVVHWTLEQQDVWLWLVDFVVLPSQGLGDTDCAPFLLPEQLQSALALVMVLIWNNLEHSLWELNVTVLVLIIVVSGAVVDSLNKLIQARLLILSERTWDSVATTVIDVHRGHCCGFRFWGDVGYGLRESARRCCRGCESADSNVVEAWTKATVVTDEEGALKRCRECCEMVFTVRVFGGVCVKGNGGAHG